MPPPRHDRFMTRTGCEECVRWLTRGWRAVASGWAGERHLQWHVRGWSAAGGCHVGGMWWQVGPRSLWPAASRPLVDQRMADEGRQATEQRRTVATVATYAASTYSGADAGARVGRGDHAHPPPGHSPDAPACRTSAA